MSPAERARKCAEEMHSRGAPVLWSDLAEPEHSYRDIIQRHIEEAVATERHVRETAERESHQHAERTAELHIERDQLREEIARLKEDLRYEVRNAAWEAERADAAICARGTEEKRDASD